MTRAERVIAAARALREAGGVPEVKKRARTKCSSKGFCDGLVYVCELSKKNARGGLEISYSASRVPGAGLKFRERAIVRQVGYKPVIVINYCPFCGVKYKL